MKSLRSLLRVGLGATALLVGCDGGDGPPTCGGDIVGSWRISSSAVTIDYSASMNPECPAATGKAVDFKITGTATYNADLTFAATYVFSGKFALTRPRECLGTSTCAELAADLQANPNFTASGCVAAGTGCTCTIGLPPETVNESGTYVTAGGTLTATETGGQPQQSGYCVQGTTLRMSYAERMADGDGDATGTLTFMKE